MHLKLQSNDEQRRSPQLSVLGLRLLGPLIKNSGELQEKMWDPMVWEQAKRTFLQIEPLFCSHCPLLYHFSYM